MPGRVTVVGLGPGGLADMTVGALAAVESAGHLLLRTSRHPAAADLAARGVRFETCDDIYDSAADFGSAYAAIVSRVLEAVGAAGPVVYAVPGSPHVAEATVRILRERAGAAGTEVDFVEGISFLEPVLAAVGADPAVGGVVVCDGRNLDDQIGRWFPGDTGAVLPNLVVCQVDKAEVLGDAKLALLEVIAPDQEVALVRGAGSPEVEVHRCALAELDWGQVDPGPLASLWVPSAVPAGTDSDAGALPFEVGPAHREAGRSFAALVALIDRLRSPGGCPWDAEQTHASLARHLLEEAYEVLDVLDEFPHDAPPVPAAPGTYAALEEELGDLLMQTVFHARLAQECGAFDAVGVVDAIVAKLVARHPHVFGDVRVTSGSEVVANWEAIKREEKGRTSILDGVPPALPALARAAKLIRRSETSGLRWGDTAGVVGRAGTGTGTGDVGAVLLAVCAWARSVGVDPEEALRSTLARFESAVRAAEAEGTLDGDAWELVDTGEFG